jgi:hypothetical protein
MTQLHASTSLYSAKACANAETYLTDGLVNKGTIVLISGTLKWSGGGAACEVLARKVTKYETHSHRPTYIYTDCSVLNAPEHLPDGDYVLHFDGFSALVTKNRAGWLPYGPVVKDFLSPTAK